MDHIALMARFNQWVNARLFDSVAALSDEAYRADRGAYFGSIHRTLNHVLVVDRLWSGRIEGIDRGVRALDQVLYDDLAALRAARREEDKRLIALVDRLAAEGRLGEAIVYRRILGAGEQRTRCDHVLITLFNHQTHHRGQVHAMLTQAGVTPGPWDVIWFLEECGGRINCSLYASGKWKCCWVRWSFYIKLRI
jgi:uncharacterized damage-inducible protein DinB